ncbi:hypothetical protein [Micromonospora sp. NPDC003816]|uniref:hypothetical protein n=1 Tax=Micromonospora sp. NPDC003816 TaxID=3364224 RepID=UPI0036A4256D
MSGTQPTKDPGLLVLALLMSSMASLTGLFVVVFWPVAAWLGALFGVALKLIMLVSWRLTRGGWRRNIAPKEAHRLASTGIALLALVALGAAINVVLPMLADDGAVVRTVPWITLALIAVCSVLMAVTGRVALRRSQ